MRTFAGILRFEWRYHTRQRTFYAMAAAVAVGSFMLVQSGYGPPNVYANSPYVVTQSMGLISLLCVFVLTVFCANAALRDVEHGFTELVFSTPVSKPDYLLGRFLGALAAGVSVMVVAMIVMMLMPVYATVDAARIGPVRTGAYVWAMLIIVIPNLMLICALLFAVAVTTRSTLATYVGAVAIYALYLVCSLLVDSPLMAGAAPPTAEGLARAALLDPFALSAFFEQTRYWTPAERNVRLPLLTGHMLMNRALWTAVAIAVFAITYRVFSFRTIARSTTRAGRTRRTPRSTPATRASRLTHITDRDTVGSVRAPLASGKAVPIQRSPSFVTFLSSTRLEVRHVLRGWTFGALLALWAFVALMQAVAQLSGGDYGTRIVPTTGALIEAMRLPLLIIGTITIVYYAAEIAWRERAVKVDALVDATPVPDITLYGAKAAALGLLPVIMTAVAVVVGIAVQLAHGYTRMQPGLYASMFWFAALPLVLFAIAALALQVVLPNRWLGMLGGLVLGVVARMGGGIGIDHPMLRFSAAPAVEFSEMAGFDGAGPTFAAFMLFWAAISMLLAVVSIAFWRRGARNTRALRSLGAGRRRALAGATIVCIAAAAALFHQTNIAHAWQGRDAQMEWASQYERQYRRISHLPEPSVIAVRTNVDLFPSEKRAVIRGTYTLANRTGSPIDTIWISLPNDAESAHATVAGATVRVDSMYHMVEIALPQPLAPMQEVALTFVVALDRGGIRATGVQHDIATNGSFLTNARAYPSIGYRAGYEIDDARLRKEHNLEGSASAVAKLDTAGIPGTVKPAPLAWITLDATVSTEMDQTAFVEGRLDSMWIRDGRRHFHYVTDAPVTPLFAVVSGRYTVQKGKQGDVDVEVWHHADHAANAPRILADAKRALALLSARFGPYPHRTLRIVETPAWSSFGGFALPGMIYFRETGGFLTDPSPDDADLITRRTAHEVAHQWWGHTLAPAAVEGASVLVETLAKYSEQLVVADVHGAAALRPILAFDEDRYLAGRALELATEPTLMTTVGREYMYYGKGAIVMNGLRDLIGAEAVDSALSRLIATRGGPGGAATTLDLRNALEAQSKVDNARKLIAEWLGGRTLYDLRIDTVESAANADATGYRVRASISTTKYESVNGADKPASVNGESFDVALYKESPDDGKLLYAAKHVPVNGRITLDIVLTEQPDYIVADPEYRRIDATRSNNTKRIPPP